MRALLTGCVMVLLIPSGRLTAQVPPGWDGSTRTFQVLRRRGQGYPVVLARKTFEGDVATGPPDGAGGERSSGRGTPHGETSAVVIAAFNTTNEAEPSTAQERAVEEAALGLLWSP